MKKKFVWGAMILLMVMAVGCATLGLKPWAERTPEEKALAIVQTYNDEDRDVRALATAIVANPNAYTEAEKKAVRAKKATLVELKPYVDIYKTAVLTGQIPSKETEDKIIELLRKLGRRI